MRSGSVSNCMLQVDLAEFTARLHEIELKKPEWVPKIRSVAATMKESLAARCWPIQEEHELDQLNHIEQLNHMTNITNAQFKAFDQHYQCDAIVSDSEFTSGKPPTTPEEHEFNSEWASGVPPLAMEYFSDAVASQVPCLIIRKHWMPCCHCQVRDIANAVYVQRAKDEMDKDNATSLPRKSHAVVHLSLV